MRVGRSSAAKEFDAGAIELAVKAHIRRVHTGYDRLLSQGLDRTEARAIIGEKLSAVEGNWKEPSHREQGN